MKNNPTSSKKLAQFQQMQYDFSNHIRDPSNKPFQPLKLPGVAPLTIEPRRLEAYETLFYNNLYEFFSNIFPVLKQFMGEARWHELTREYMQKHCSKSPLFHELGQEFLSFLQNEYSAKKSDPEFMLELAHYEWVELAVSIEVAEGPLNALNEKLDWQKVYQLSPVAWPLAYEWPVHRLNPKETVNKPEWTTTLLVYRDDEDIVQFMELSPVLYELLNLLIDNEENSAEVVLSSLAESLGQSVESMQDFAESILQEMLDKNIILEVLPS